MEVRAIARGVRISHQKVQPVADMVRGRMVDEALALLQFTPKRAARVIEKVVRSAAANAENNLQLSPQLLKIVHITADQGTVLKRFRPQARGRTNPLLKRSCHITVVVGEVGDGT